MMNKIETDFVNKLHCRFNSKKTNEKQFKRNSKHCWITGL